MTAPPWHYTKIKNPAHYFFLLHVLSLALSPTTSSLPALVGCCTRSSLLSVVCCTAMFCIGADVDPYQCVVACCSVATYLNNVFLIPGSGRPTTNPRRTVSWTSLVLKRTMPSRTAVLAALAATAASMTVAPVTRSNTLALMT